MHINIYYQFTLHSHRSCIQCVSAGWILDRGRISFIVLLLVNSNSSSLSYSGWSDHKRKYYLTILFFSGKDDWTDIGVEEVGQCWAGCVSLPFWNLPDQSAWEVGRDVDDVIGGEGKNSWRKQLLRNFKLTKICTAGSALFGNNTFPEEVSFPLWNTKHQKPKTKILSFTKVCRNLADGNHSSQQKEVQATVQKFNAAELILKTTPLIFVIIFLGSWFEHVAQCPEIILVPGATRGEGKGF